MALSMKLTTDFIPDPNALTPLAQQSVIIDMSCTLPYGELAKLYRTIEATLPEGPGRVVQFVSAYQGEGTDTIAFETAIIAAQMIGQRVLYIDTHSARGLHGKLPDGVGVPLDTLILTGRPPQEGIAQASGTNLYFIRLRKHDKEGFPLASLQAMEMALATLRSFFDFIVIDSQAILKDAFGIALAKMVDGSVLVIEAERTRATVALESKRLMEAGGGRVIGTVLNRRRFYIPRFLYRFLYPRNSV